MILALALAALIAAPARAVPFKVEHLVAAHVGEPAYDVAAERVLVKFSTAGAPGVKAAVLAMIGGSVMSESPTGWTIVQLSSGASVLGPLAALKDYPGVDAVAPDRVLTLDATPSDPGVAAQYALTSIDLFNAWDIENGATNKVTVAMIDAGISPVADLAGKIVSVGAIKSQFFDPNAAGAQSVNDPPTPACSHATQTASVAAATTNNGAGIAGASWGAQLISLKVFADINCNPAGDCPAGCDTTDSAISKALDYGANTLQNNAAIGKLVINISIGGNASCGSLPLTNASLGNAVTKGVPVTISAGNTGGAVNSPANCATTGIIPVGATDSSDQIATFSSRGPELAAWGLSAPGKDVRVDTLGGNMATVSGTSFSAPYAAGVAALMLSAKPALTPAQVQSLLRQGADSTGLSSLGNTTGAGRLNAFHSVALAAGRTLNADLSSKAFIYPNPFRPSTDPFARINIPKGAEGSTRAIKIYTPAGQLVRAATGLTWDGKNDAGTLVATGTYVFSIKIDDTVYTGRVAVIR